VAPFHVAIDKQASCTVVSVVGELDIASAPELEDRLAAAESAGNPSLVVDLNRLDFIDSTGLSTLVRSSKRMEQVGVSFALVCQPDRIEVHRVLEILGFDEVFTIHPTLTDAGCTEVSAEPAEPAEPS
jgi:anti-sigma B factor antagonist